MGVLLGQFIDTVIDTEYMGEHFCHRNIKRWRHFFTQRDLTQHLHQARLLHNWDVKLFRCRLNPIGEFALHLLQLSAARPLRVS